MKQVVRETNNFLIKISIIPKEKLILDEDVLQVFTDLLTLHINKYQTYRDSYRKIGVLGIFYRIKDKLNRIENILKNLEIDNLPIEEEFADISLLAVLGLTILKTDEFERKIKICQKY